MKTITVKVYDFDELEGQAKNNARNNVIQGLINHLPYEHMTDNMKKAMDRTEELQTPWFAHEYMLDYARQDVEEECKQRQYTANGDLFPWWVTDIKGLSW
jgi:DNA gyrase/topoisomerase IV subunit B